MSHTPDTRLWYLWTDMITSPVREVLTQLSQESQLSISVCFWGLRMYITPCLTQGIVIASYSRSCVQQRRGGEIVLWREEAVLFMPSTLTKMRYNMIPCEGPFRGKRYHPTHDSLMLPHTGSFLSGSCCSLLRDTHRGGDGSTEDRKVVRRRRGKSNKKE